MPKYIDADELLHRLPDDLPYKASVKRVLIQAPASDVVEVVHCEKCEHWVKKGYDPIFERKFGYCYNNDFPFHCEERPIINGNDFCSYGKRK